MKRIIAIVAVLILAICALTSLVACEQADYTIGICQLATHPALDAATQGFKDALDEEMTKAGKTVKYNFQNANGDQNTCTQIISTFVAQNVDLMLANATDPLISAANATDKIPILGTSVTSYEDAFKNGRPANVSGTSDLAPLDKQAQMIIDLVPNAKTVGLLYCSAESNSKYQINIVKAHLEAKGLTCRDYGFAETSQLQQIVTAATQVCDVIYIPTDNTVAAAAPSVDPICSAANVPVIAGEEGICKGCGIATLSISYYDLGYKTGKMAAKILLEGEDISKMDVQFADATTPKYHEERCNKLGITIPEGQGYEKLAVSED